MTGLSGNTALITGAARGQGRSHATRFAEEGANLVLVDVCEPVAELGYPPATRADLDETVALAREAGARVVAEVADVRDLDAMTRAVQRGVDEFGRLDTVVANAGISAWGRLWEIEEQQWRAVLDTNLTGVWHTLRAAVPTMIDGGYGGSIITISSLAGLKALPGQVHYSAAKHGLVGLTKAAALELGEFGIRVNSVHPWAVDTPMADDNTLRALLRENESYLKSFGQVLTEPEIAAPADISDAVVWLASEQSRTVTGVEVPVAMGANLI